jgi:hypothetical protein
MRDEGFPNSPEGNPNLLGRKSKPDRKEIQENPEGNPSICLPRILTYQGLTATPHGFFLFGPLPASNAPRRGAGGAKSPRSVCRSFCLHIGFSGLLKQVKGWRHFDIADCVLVRRLDAACADLSAASLIGREGIPGASPVMRLGKRTHGKRQADRSDVRQELRPLKEPDPVSGLWISGRAPALRASRVSHDPCL